MPVPISVTHAQGKGLASHQIQELESEGPFARLKRPTEINDTETEGVVENRGNVQGQVGTSGAQDIAGVETKCLNFWYPDIDGRPLTGCPPVVQDMSVFLPRGATCLLIGPNGAGKTTLLKVLAGQHMVSKSSVSVLGQPPFHATSLTASGALSYIGGNWERDVAFAGYSVPLAGDIPASQMLNSLPGIDPKRREKLIQVLDIDPNWRMHLVSDGQRRRVQLAMGLLRPFQVLLLDEVTVDLDVLGRSDLMKFLKQECLERGATIMYATHIFDGLETWPTHLMYVAGGRLKIFEKSEAFPELREGRLLHLVEKWLRSEEKERVPVTAFDQDNGSEMNMPGWRNGYSAGRLTSSMKLSSNAVMRM